MKRKIKFNKTTLKQEMNVASVFLLAVSCAVVFNILVIIIRGVLQ